MIQPQLWLRDKEWFLNVMSLADYLVSENRHGSWKLVPQLFNQGKLIKPIWTFARHRSAAACCLLLSIIPRYQTMFWKYVLWFLLFLFIPQFLIDWLTGCNCIFTRSIRTFPNSQWALLFSLRKCRAHHHSLTDYFKCSSHPWNVHWLGLSF